MPNPPSGVGARPAGVERPDVVSWPYSPTDRELTCRVREVGHQGEQAGGPPEEAPQLEAQVEVRERLRIGAHQPSRRVEWRRGGGFVESP